MPPSQHPYEPPAPPQTLVREYRTAKDYQKDAAKLARDGWRVVSTMQGKGRWTAGQTATRASAFLLLGPFALIGGRKRLVVTYTR